MVAVNFDASRVDPAAPGGTIPSGDYDVQIVESGMKPTKNGAGQYLELKMRVMTGEFAGRPLTSRLNIQNSNQQAVEIAYAELSAICHVTGVIQCQDTVQLHNRPFRVRVIEEPRADNPQLKGNEIKGFMDAHGNQPGAFMSGAQSPTPSAPPQPQPQPQPQPAPPGGNAPWQGGAAAPLPAAQQAPFTPGMAPVQAPGQDAAAAPGYAPAQTQVPGSAPVQQQPQPQPAPAGNRPPWEQ